MENAKDIKEAVIELVANGPHGIGKEEAMYSLKDICLTMDQDGTVLATGGNLLSWEQTEKAWKAVKEAVATIKGAKEFKDNRIAKESTSKKSNFPTIYQTTGPLKPIYYKYIPKSEYNKKQQSRTMLLGGKLVQRTDSAREYAEPSASAPEKRNAI